MVPDQWHPGRLLAISGSYWQTCALHAGVKLEIFSTIGNESLTAPAIAGKLETNEDGTARLLDALTAMALISKKDGQYQNTPESLRYLSKNSDEYIGYMILHHHHLMESWSRLDESVSTGQPIVDQLPISEEERLENFLMGMFNTASVMAPGLVKALDLSDRRHLLDLGGGPGTYAIHFCRQYPQLAAAIFDLPTTRPFAEKTIARFDLSDRIRFTAGDYTAGNIPGRYDVVWMSHILHSENPDVVVPLLKKIAAVLEPGGVLMVHDFILDDTLDGPLFPALFSLNMLVRTKSGRSYSEKEITNMLREGGFKTVTRHPFRGPTESSVMIGTM